MAVKRLFQPGQRVKVVVESNRNHGRIGFVDRYTATGKSVWVDLGEGIGVQRFMENSLEAVRRPKANGVRKERKEKRSEQPVKAGKESGKRSERMGEAMLELLEQVTRLIRVTADQIEGRARE